MRRGAPSLRVLEFLILFCTVWFLCSGEAGLGIKLWCRSHTDTACFSADNGPHAHPALHSLSQAASPGESALGGGLTSQG